MTDSDLLARRSLLLGEGTPLFYEEPALVRGEGVMLYDAEDRQHVDMYNVPCRQPFPRWWHSGEAVYSPPRATGIVPR